MINNSYIISDEESDKKKRAPNFTLREKSLLLNLISQYKNVIENKKTDSMTWKQKDQAWEKIKKLFNCQNPESTPRSKESLKKYYDNTKKNVRKQVAEEKAKFKRTGESPGPKKQEDPTTDLCLSIMNRKTVFGLSNEFDGDSNQANRAVTETVTVEPIINNTSPIYMAMNEPTEHNYCFESSPDSPYLLTNDDCKTTPQPSTSKEDPMEDQTEQTWSKIAASQLKQGVNENLTHKWTKRRRPTPKQLSSSKLETDYCTLAKLKTDVFGIEKENIAKREKREEELFQLQKKKIMLEIQIDELRLKKLQHSFIE